MPAPSPAKSLGAPEPAAPRWTGFIFGALRSARRSIGFALALTFAAVDYVRALCFRRRRDARQRRALWLQRTSRMILRLIGLELHHCGTPPSSGLVVSNHLSYLDILAYSALVPCVFVAKSEVASWPVLGLFARMGGTIFVDRTRRMKVGETNQQIAETLQSGAVVVIFAEGTSSDGQTVLPFRSSLMEPVASSDATVVPAAIRYHLEEGSVADEVCYWRDMTLLPHLLNLFGKRSIGALVGFGPGEPRTVSPSRKELAQQLHQRVSELHLGLNRDAHWPPHGAESRARTSRAS